MKTHSRPVPVNARQLLCRLIILSVCMLLSSCLSSLWPAQAPPPQRESKPTRQAQASPAVPPASSEASLCLSLALPLQGSVKSIAEKITQGASIAKRELELQGTRVSVRILDADQPDWLNQLAALPPECALVGGPMQTAAYSAAKKSPAAVGRAFFAFLPQLEPGDEGFTAWRFFPSPQDQADALLSFLQIEMAFTAYGVFYPDVPYGSRMAEIFRQRAALRGAVVQTASYTPGAAATWPNAAAKLVGKHEINKTPFPTANLQALFLPDSWSSVEQLITSLHYNGEDRLVLLGDSLWADGIQQKPPALPQNYQLAVFPGAWNPGLASPGAQALKASMQSAAPDFWIGLGYDFLHFAVHMKLAAGWTPQMVTQRATEAQRHVAWSMAPLAWDAQGKATQALFLFSPVAGGFAPVQPQQLKTAWQEAQDRFAERLRIAQGESPAPVLIAPPASASPLRLPPPTLDLPPSAPATPVSGTKPLER